MSRNHNVLITYLITTRNRARYLERTIANVRKFITSDDELIIIDGASTDNTKDVVERNKDIVHLFLSENDCGEAHAFNKGLFRARGKYLKIVTDDDYIYPDAMRKLVSTVIEHPEVDAIQCGGSNWIMTEQGPEFVNYRRLPDRLSATASNIFDRAFAGQGLIVKRSAFEKFGGLNCRYKSADGDLMSKIIEAGCSIRYLDIELFKWYSSPHSTSRTMDDTRHKQELFSFYIRMGRWSDALSLADDATELLAILNLSDRSHNKAMARALWLGASLERSRVRGILALIVSAMDSFVRVGRFVLLPFRKSRPSRNADSAHPDPKELAPWTGVVR